NDSKKEINPREKGPGLFRKHVLGELDTKESQRNPQKRKHRREFAQKARSLKNRLSHRHATPPTVVASEPSILKYNAEFEEKESGMATDVSMEETRDGGEEEAEEEMADEDIQAFMTEKEKELVAEVWSRLKEKGIERTNFESHRWARCGNADGTVLRFLR